MLPHIRSFDDPAQMEEERRLCYVGMTRAKERLYLLRAFRRYSMGDVAARAAVALPARHAAGADRRSSRRCATKPRPPSAARIASARRSSAGAERGPARADGGFGAGEKVRHPRFGEGIVVSSTPVGDDQEVTIAFKGEAGIKRADAVVRAARAAVVTATRAATAPRAD